MNVRELKDYLNFCLDKGYITEETQLLVLGAEREILFLEKVALPAITALKPRNQQTCTESTLMFVKEY